MCDETYVERAVLQGDLEVHPHLVFIHPETAQHLNFFVGAASALGPVILMRIIPRAITKFSRPVLDPLCLYLF